MNLENLKKVLISQGCSKIYIKRLAPNDNSKNQVYFGGSFEILNILPITKIESVNAGDWKRERFKASINFSWIIEDGSLSPAKNAQLILYPKYPEVRFSGFLMGSKKAPSELMTQRLPNRLLFIGVDIDGNVLGYVAHPESEISKEFSGEKIVDEHGVFSCIDLPGELNNRSILLRELKRIHQLGWINAKRLDSGGSIVNCSSSNCGGYTLEAELGVKPNGYSEPDFMGWEVKQFGVKKFENINSSTITLMTPEPTHGLYKSKGTEFFIRNYGYPDKLGRPDRMNFGGIHKVGEIHHTTKLELKLIGFDLNTGRIRKSDGSVALIDQRGNITASWSFSSMLLHWNRKHNKACYVPSLSMNNGNRKYKYGNNIIIGTGTDFQLFLNQMAIGNIYFDPGIKLENMSNNPKIKKRSQFRIKSRNLSELYKLNEIINL